METLLFVNACISMKGEAGSRTYKMCREYLDKHLTAHPNTKVEEVKLEVIRPQPFDRETILHRENRVDKGLFDDPIFDLSRQFIAADFILVGAPYWDLSFPAVLKAYIEHVTVRDLAFRFTGEKIVGQARAKKLVYITTAGGYVGDYDFGADYFRGLCGFYGIGEFESLSQEGLDIKM